MFGSAKGAAQGKAACKDYGACSGCSLCLLVCPVWRQTHDPRMTPEGRAKALQHGATAQDIAASVQACRLCGACEPVCPEGIDLVGMTLDLRARLVDTGMAADRRASMLETASRRLAPVGASVAFLPGPALRAKPEVLRRVCELLGAGPSADDGMDLLEAFAAGVPVPRERKDRLIAHLGGARLAHVLLGRLEIRHAGNSWKTVRGRRTTLRCGASRKA